eukprot:tig00021179_g19238.t1
MPALPTKPVLDTERLKLKTFHSFLIASTQASGMPTQPLRSLLMGLAFACKSISSLISRSNAGAGARVLGVQDLAGIVNVQGEAQIKLDVLSNELFIRALSDTCRARVLASEEEDNVIIVDSANEDECFAVVFDPLDGSSNLDLNITVGSIFGVYRVPPGTYAAAGEPHVLRRGRDLICAGYAMYGSSCMLVLTFGDQPPVGFTLDTLIGEFLLTHPAIRMPSTGTIYSINESAAASWDPVITSVIKQCKEKKFNARYVGSMVADMHRTLLKGGVFIYPADSKSPSGKLRLLYECNPFAFIVEAAGGRAITGQEDVLDVQPKGIHQRVPVYIGSKTLIDEIEAAYKKGNAAA